MKKEINKIIIVLGFIIAIVGLCISIYETELFLTSIYSRPIVFSLFAVTCIFATNPTIKNIGYTLNVILALEAIHLLMIYSDIGLLICSIGLFLMAVGALVYFLIIFLGFCGFVKKGKRSASPVNGNTLLDELIRYKEMQQEKVLTEEEFSDIKQKIFDSCDNKIGSIDDLKKWKKLLDQQVITEEEFSKIKADIFCK